MSNELKKVEETTDNVETTEISNEQVAIKIDTEYAKSLTTDELKAKIEELEKASEEYGKGLTQKKYAVKFENEKNLRGLIKFLEKNVNWNHNNVPTYIAVYHGFKDLLKGDKPALDENGNAHVSGAVVGGVYQYLLAITGKGYFEAKEYLRVLTEVGKPISDSMKELADDNEKFRNMHTDLSTLDTELLAREQGINVETPLSEKTNSEDTESK